ncbi:MAG TPA: MBL fold metallo-hydrolase [Candidatus Aerophobetes bacterium]|uniref:MBL fold metallo-hydrolase n=1 Tax=Aerophobetes bacterium TaxID=2030807 RepID=A0A7V5HZZ8_UNCAE|nr:MBL fold metallo-hydrolase [Candidatus Aerophobetes bacterium]
MLHNIKITILCDNIVEKSSLLAEHGFSVLIETEKIKILFDTGQGLCLRHNAKVLNVNLTSIDKVVVSHAHYDHTGGIKEILKKNPKIPIHAHPDIFNPKYKKSPNGKMDYIGIPKFLLKSKSSFNFVLNEGPFHLTKDILLTGKIPRETAFERTNEDFYIKTDKGYIEDDLKDDQALVINTNSGLVLILGCAHSGLINTLNYAVKLTGKNNFHLVLGGTHLKNANNQRIKKTAALLSSFQIEKIVLSHCTGIQAFINLHHVLGDKVSIGKVGESFTVPTNRP